MFCTSGGKSIGIKLLSTEPPDYCQSGGFWQFILLFWQLMDVILIVHQLQNVLGTTISRYLRSKARAQIRLRAQPWPEERSNLLEYKLD